MLFTKADLLYNYNWQYNKKDNAKPNGGPDSSLLNRNEGYEVLYVIHKLMAAWGLKQRKSGQKIEKMIMWYPNDLESLVAVKEWIQNNWNLY